MRFRFPETIHDDQGGEFENQLFYNLGKLSGVKHSHTTPYYPQGNGQVKRFNRTLLRCINASSITRETEITLARPSQ